MTNTSYNTTCICANCYFYSWKDQNCWTRCKCRRKRNKQRKIWNFVKFWNVKIFVLILSKLFQRRIWRSAELGTGSTNKTCGVNLAGEAFFSLFSSFFSVFCPGSQGWELHGWFYNNTADLWSSVSHSDELWLRGVGDVLITASSNVLIIDRLTQSCSSGRHLCRLGVGGVYNYHQNQSLSQ